LVNILIAGNGKKLGSGISKVSEAKGVIVLTVDKWRALAGTFFWSLLRKPEFGVSV